MVSIITKQPRTQLECKYDTKFKGEDAVIIWRLLKFPEVEKIVDPSFILAVITHERVQSATLYIRNFLNHAKWNKTDIFVAYSIF